MSSFWSRNISLSIFGESHGPAIGVVIDNLPPGEYIDVEKLRQFMALKAVCILFHFLCRRNNDFHKRLTPFAIPVYIGQNFC